MTGCIISSIAWATIIASMALILSLVNTYFAWRRRIFEADQEKRRKLNLEASLVHCFYQFDQASGDRLYAFQLTVRNPSDSRNAISEADLSITYITKDRTQMTVRIGTNGQNIMSFVQGEVRILPIPTQILAHDTISGWLQFKVPRTIHDETKIDSYQIILRDTAGHKTQITPILIREYYDET